MRTEIYVWSRSGHTPVTKRGGAYCDVLLHTDVDCETPEEARAFVQDMIREIPGGDYGHFYIHGYWNQNTSSGWTH